MAPWWVERHKIMDEYIAEYRKRVPATEPVEDFQDRGALYML